MSAHKKRAASSAKGATQTHTANQQDYPNVIDDARAQKIAERRNAMPEVYRGLSDRVTAGTASPRDAIKAQCLECVCWQKREVTECTALACPLYAYRSYQKPVESPTGGTLDARIDDLDSEAT